MCVCCEQAIAEGQGKLCDFLHVDGDHRYAGALADLQSMSSLARCNATLVLDDTFFDSVEKAWQAALFSTLVVEDDRSPRTEIQTTTNGQTIVDPKEWVVGRYRDAACPGLVAPRPDPRLEPGS